MKNEMRNFTEVEEIIEQRIAEERELYDLDTWEIAEIRMEIYKANGWSYDPFPIEEDEEEEPWDDEDCHILSLGEELQAIGMSSREFF